MAKIQIKSEKLTPFGGIFSIMEQFDALLAQTIDSTLGLRCTMFGYQYSEILRSLMCVYLFLWIFQGFCKELYLSSPLRFGGVFCGYSLRSSGRSAPGRPAFPREVFHDCHDAGEYCFVYSVSLLMTENIRCTSFALRTFIILITCLPSFSLRS